MVDDHLEAGLGRGGQGEAMGSGQVRGGVGVGAVAGHVGGQVHAY